MLRHAGGREELAAALAEVDLLSMKEQVREAFFTTILGSSFDMKDLVSVLLAAGEPLVDVERMVLQGNWLIETVCT